MEIYQTDFFRFIAFVLSHTNDWNIIGYYYYSVQIKLLHDNYIIYNNVSKKYDI